MCICGYLNPLIKATNVFVIKRIIDFYSNMTSPTNAYKIHKHVRFFYSENSSHPAVRRIHLMLNENYRQKSVLQFSYFKKKRFEYGFTTFNQNTCACSKSFKSITITRTFLFNLQLALKFHPDKNPDNPDATEKVR